MAFLIILEALGSAMSNISVELASIFISIKDRITSRLPVGHSFIPLELMVTVIANSNTDKLKVSELFDLLPYSNIGIRYHYKTLVEDGWFDISECSNDRRVKYVQPSEKLTNTFTLLGNEILENSFFNKTKNRI